MSRPEIVSRAEWLGAQKALLDPLELGVFVASVYFVMGVAGRPARCPGSTSRCPGRIARGCTASRVLPARS